MSTHDDAYDVDSFTKGLIEHGLIVPVRVQGAFGRGAVFESVLEAFDRMIARIAKEDRAEVYTFPPVIDRQIIEKAEYFESFPHLSGVVSSFFGKDRQAFELANRVKEEKPYHELLGPTDVCLNPAACYPLYPTMTGRLPTKGRLVTMFNWVYRHEPSPEPTRMQAFRVREMVRAGTPEDCLEWRDMWLERGVSILRDLGLPAEPDVAADPFFGRGGAMLADGQKAQKLKFEVNVPVISKEKPTAVCSFNYHTDKFGKVFGIEQSEGDVAHTACLGFGLERVVMALFRHHGFVVEEWPKAVQGRLWP